MEQPIATRVVLETPILRDGMRLVADAIAQELERRESLTALLDIHVIVQPLERADLVESGTLAP